MRHLVTGLVVAGLVGAVGTATAQPPGGRGEDVRDHREDVRDQREDVRDAKGGPSSEEVERLRQLKDQNPEAFRREV